MRRYCSSQCGPRSSGSVGCLRVRSQARPEQDWTINHWIFALLFFFWPARPRSPAGPPFSVDILASNARRRCEEAPNLLQKFPPCKKGRQDEPGRGGRCAFLEGRMPLNVGLNAIRVGRGRKEESLLAGGEKPETLNHRPVSREGGQGRACRPCRAAHGRDPRDGNFLGSAEAQSWKSARKQPRVVDEHPCVACFLLLPAGYRVCMSFEERERELCTSSLCLCLHSLIQRIRVNGERGGRVELMFSIIRHGRPGGFVSGHRSRLRQRA